MERIELSRGYIHYRFKQESLFEFKLVFELLI